MAYAATVELSEIQAGGEAYTVVTVTETGVTGATDETQIDNLPQLGTVTEVHSTLTAGGGTATTVQPRLGEIAGGNSVYAAGSAAAYSHSGTLSKVYSDIDTGSKFRSGRLYWSARANGTTTGSGQVVSQIVIKHGHHP